MKRDDLGRAFAVAGTILVWLTVLGPIAFAAQANLQSRGSGSLFVDVTLFAVYGLPIGILGGVLLLAGAFRARFQRVLMGSALAFAVATSITLAAGVLPEWVAGVFGVVYLLALVVLAVLGAMLTVRLFRRHDELSPPAISAS